MNIEIFMITILVLKVEAKILIDLLAKITILTDYLDYINILLFEFAIKFLKYNNNNFIIKLKKGKEPFYDPIYNLRIIKLKILKAYIKTNLANDFI